MYTGYIIMNDANKMVYYTDEEYHQFYDHAHPSMMTQRFTATKVPFHHLIYAQSKEVTQTSTPSSSVPATISVKKRTEEQVYDYFQQVLRERTLARKNKICDIHKAAKTALEKREKELTFAKTIVKEMYEMHKVSKDPNSLINKYSINEPMSEEEFQENVVKCNSSIKSIEDDVAQLKKVTDDAEEVMMCVINE